MAEHIQSGTSYILKQNQLAEQKLQRATDQLVTGKKLLRPGDDMAAYAEVQQLDFAQSTEQAQIQAAQMRLSWYQTSTMFLSQVVETLSSMSELAAQARGSLSSEQDILVLDEAFQGYKQQISSVVDGNAGQKTPTATFHDKPLFIGFSPSLEIGAHVSTALNGVQDVNLYTGYMRDGFDALNLVSTDATSAEAIALTGTALGGNFDRITLDTAATSQEDAYKGMTIRITGGTGAGEVATIASYDAQTRTAYFTAPLATQLNATSQYSLESGYSNHGLNKVEGFTQIKVSDAVWGADNDRLESLTEGAAPFRALTEEERVYRTANSISDTDLEAKTFEEKEARRKLNIFDAEYGNLKTAENRERMYGQVQNAIQQITVFLQRHDSRAATLNSQIETFQQRYLSQNEGAQAIGGADPFATAADYQRLSLEPEKLLSLAARLQENLGRINDLVQNKGVR